MAVVLLVVAIIGSEPDVQHWNPDAGQASDPSGQLLKEIIDGLLHNPDPKVRRRAAWALSSCSSPSVVEPLIQAFQDRDAEVRKLATDRFSNYPDKRAVEAFIKLLKDPESTVRNAALHKLWRLEDPRFVPPLMEVLQNTREDGPNRSAAAWDLTHFRDPRALSPFLAVLKDRTAPQHVRCSAAEGLRALKDKRAVEPLLAVLTNKSEPWLSRAGAARALADFEDMRAAKPLLDVARADGSPLLRFWGAIGAAKLSHGALDDASVIEPIADYFKSGDGVEYDIWPKRVALGLVLQNGKNESTRLFAARMFLQVEVERWFEDKVRGKDKQPEEPEVSVTKGDKLLRELRLPEAKVLLENARSSLPKVKDRMQRAQLEATIINDLAALADAQQRWAGATPKEIETACQGVKALSGKSQVFFQGDPYLKHHARYNATPCIPIGADVLVEAIKGDGEEFSDSDLKYLKGMPNLRDLDLYWARNVTGAGLKSIQDAKNLRKLNLPDSIADSDLKWIGGLTQLEDLSLNGSDITDEGLPEVTKLRQLKCLALMGGSITDSGVGRLMELKNLEELSLSGKKITDNSLENLKALPKLSRLSLLQTGITDNGLKHLAQLKHLKTLHLGQNQIGDAGLEHLAALGQLEELSVNNTRVTEQGLKKLQQSLPNCEIMVRLMHAGPEHFPR
ncbi:MAG: HEAT repeat domain-containing protein [Planctomycetia bacterium]|nr:HEAT repeat domain-containing protein [Planctomycetia bacterium]